MKVPDNVTGMIAKVNTEMPEVIEEYINYEHTGIPCELSRAVMPEGNSAIKDCIRIFKSEDNKFDCGIRNNDFALIEKSDVVEMYIGQNNETEEDEPKALLIKRFTFGGSEPELIGVVFLYKWV